MPEEWANRGRALLPREGLFCPGKGGGGEDGGARRNRTADDGFADHCLTTWRPRHRTNEAGSSEGAGERKKPSPPSPLLCATNFCRSHLPTGLKPATTNCGT